MQQNRRLALLLRSRIQSITPAPSPKLLLIRSHQLSDPRQLSSPCRRYASSLQDIPPWAGIREVARPTAMWLAPNDTKFNQQQVLDQLPDLRGSYEDLSVVLFFVTPKLAYLFQGNHPFHSRAINTIYGASTKGKLRQSIVAVVDALPSLGKVKSPYVLELDGCEGIAMCISPGFDVTPAKDNDDSLPIINMTGKQPIFDHHQNVTVSYSAPVANTTFVTGQQHTMFMQNWRNLDGQQWLSETKRHNLTRVNVPIYPSALGDRMPLSMYSKILKLTDPKVILHSMGNIVRSVTTSDGKELAASHELETIVPELLKKLQKSTPTGDIRVFALVYPRKLGTQKNEFLDQVSIRELKGNSMEKVRDYHPLLTSLLVRGARLYRVTSGGAGWGKKAGLLALEPMTELGCPTEAPESPFFVFENDEDIRMPDAADLFPPGHIIQFLATFHDTEGSKKKTSPTGGADQTYKYPKSKSIKWVDADEPQKFIIGNTILPETHHYTSLEAVDEISTAGTSSNEGATSKLIFRKDQFGCLTSSALGFSVKYHSPSDKIVDQMRKGRTSFDPSDLDTNWKHSTLIELPNCCFMTTTRSDAPITGRTVSQYSGSEELKVIQDINTPTTLDRELTVQESIVAACRRLRYTESVQKASYLARKSLSVRRAPVGPIIRDVSMDGLIVNKYESSTLANLDRGPFRRLRNIVLVQFREVKFPPLERVGSHVPQSKESDHVRKIINSNTVPLRKIENPDIVVPLRRIKIIQSFRVSFYDTLPDPETTIQWQNYQSTSEPVDADERESPEPIYRYFNSNDISEVREVESRTPSDLRRLGMKSSIFRVYDSGRVDEESEVEESEVEEEELWRENQAISKLTEDL